MDAAAKTSEDTVSTSLHIKGTPTASQETNCIPNSQNTAKTSIPSTRAQFKRRSFRRFLAISRRDGSTVLPLIRAGSRMIVVVAPMVSPALFSLLTRAPFFWILDSFLTFAFMSQWRIRVGYGVQCRRPKLDIPLLFQVMALLVVIGQRMPGIIDHPAFQDEWIWLLTGIPDHVSATQLVMVELCRISQVTVGNESHVYC